MKPRVTKILAVLVLAGSLAACESGINQFNDTQYKYPEEKGGQISKDHNGSVFGGPYPWYNPSYAKDRAQYQMLVPTKKANQDPAWVNPQPAPPAQY